MSVKSEPPERPDLAALERDYLQQAQAARTLEDAKMDADYRTRRDSSRARLVDLYNRKSQLQNELQSLEAGIAYQEREQERLSREFDRAREQLRAHREDEDRRRREWFSQAREDEMKRGDCHPNTNSRAMGNGEIQPAAAAASGGWTSINGSRRPGRPDGNEKSPSNPSNLLGSVYHNPVDGDGANGHAMMRNGSGRNHLSTVLNDAAVEEDNSQARKNGERPLKPKQRHSLPTFTTVVRSPVGKPGIQDALFPDPKQRSPSGRKSLPDAKRSSTPVKQEEQVNDGKEITRHSLVFKDDGKVITEPPMYAGIPLEKIHPKHDYWEADWEPLEALIEPQVERWKEKLEALKHDPQAVRHAQFLANRQVNRGQQILDFLKNETMSFHPYQFVGKELMAKFYKTLVNYDTMFRLVNIHEELKKFDLDVTPLEWLRQRTYEVAEAEGDKFNLSKYTHNLYHDAKMKALREKHGFGNIGRPSGYKLGERDPNKAPKGKPKKESASTGASRKKARRSIGQVDPDGVPPIHDPQYGFQQPLQEVLEPVTPRLQKRQRVETTAEPPAVHPCLPPLPDPAPEVDDLEFSGYTSHDSFSNGRIMHLDWRVNQVMARNMATSPRVTQYWTWKAESSMFEHQVLRDVFPKITWGFYEKPDVFNLQLADLVKIDYARDSQKIIAVVADRASRGDILADFKRERTKRRFLSFAKKKGVTLVKKPSPEIENAWAERAAEAALKGDQPEE